MQTNRNVLGKIDANIPHKLNQGAKKKGKIILAKPQIKQKENLLPMIEIDKNDNRETVIRKLVSEYLEYLYNYNDAFVQYINAKLFDNSVNYIYFNKQEGDFYLNICSNTAKKFGKSIYCASIEKHDFLHISFHVGNKNRPLQIHIKYLESTPVIIDAKLIGNIYVLSVNNKSNKLIYDKIIKDFKNYHTKDISIETIVGLIDSLFKTYQFERNTQNGGNNCYCIKCLDEEDYVSIDYDNKFFADFIDTILEYVKMVINIYEDNNGSVVQQNMQSNTQVDVEIASKQSMNKQVVKKDMGESVIKNDITTQSGGIWYKKYLKYKHKYLMFRQNNN